MLVRYSSFIAWNNLDDSFNPSRCMFPHSATSLSYLQLQHAQLWRELIRGSNVADYTLRSESRSSHAVITPAEGPAREIERGKRRHFIINQHESSIEGKLRVSHRAGRLQTTTGKTKAPWAPPLRRPRQRHPGARRLGMTEWLTHTACWGLMLSVSGAWSYNLRLITSQTPVRLPWSCLRAGSRTRSTSSSVARRWAPPRRTFRAQKGRERRGQGEGGKTTRIGQKRFLGVVRG